jgi:hypothetical protein
MLVGKFRSEGKQKVSGCGGKFRLAMEQLKYSVRSELVVGKTVAPNERTECFKNATWKSVKVAYPVQHLNAV